MTVEEKLKHFLDSSVEDARLQSEEVIREFTKSFQDDFREYKSKVKKNARETLSREEARIRRELNHDLTTELSSVKKELSCKQEELKDKLFDEVREELNAYKKTSDYITLLKSLIKDAFAFAGDDAIKVFIDPEDANLLSDISSDFTCDINVSEESFGGGIKAIIEDRHILIDNSFDSRIAELYNNFTFNEVTWYE